MIVPPNQWWPARYICIPIWSAMHHSRVAAMQYHCCVVDWQCRARALTEWDTRVGAHHWLGKTDDEATTSAFGELYNIHCVLRHSSPIMTTSIHQASLVASTAAQAA